MATSCPLGPSKGAALSARGARRSFAQVGVGAAGLALISMLMAVPGVAAATPNRGFAISPAFQNVTVKAGQSEAQFTLEIGNNSAQDQNFRLTATDFGSLDEEGGVAFLGQPASELEHRYGLASWLKLEKDAVFVPAGKSVQMRVSLENRPSLSPGGHYGAVLATAVTDTGQAVSGDPRVGVRQVLSSLVLAIKDGGGMADLRLVSQATDAHFWHLPSTIEQRFQNVGNVHAVPRGTIEVRDPFGRVVTRGAANAESGAILPESFRRYSSPLDKIATAWAPGFYSVVSSYRYDGTSQTKTFTTHFWYAGIVAVWFTVLAAVAVTILLGWLLWRRRS